MKKLWVIFAALILGAVTGIAWAQDTADSTPEATAEVTPAPIMYTRVRAGHYAAGVSNVDIYLNGNNALRDVPFGSMTNYLTLEAALYVVTIVPSGASINTNNPVLPPFNVVLLPDRTYSLALIGDANAVTPVTESASEATAESTADATQDATSEAESTVTPEAAESPVRVAEIDETSLYETAGSAGFAHVIVLPALGNNYSVSAAISGSSQGLSNLSFGNYAAINAPPGDTALALEVLRDTEVITRADSAIALEANALYFLAIAGVGDEAQVFLQISGTRSIAQLIAGDPQFSLLYTALEATNLLDALDKDSPFTLFAPTNDAFTAWMAENDLFSDALLEDTDLLTELARYHTARGLLFSDSIASTLLIPVVNGQDIAVTSSDGDILLNAAARIVTANWLATNGVIHVVDQVLTPPADA